MNKKKSSDLQTKITVLEKSKTDKTAVTKKTIKPATAAEVTSKEKNLIVVGIGASAGGLEAMEQFFGNFPENSGMAFVVIQHLDPNHIGIMPELLQRITPMKVFQATDAIRIKPNSVYVIPPNKSLSILKGALYLFDPIETRGLRLPIDQFFLSLANDLEERSIGIILSGMGSDGIQGAKAIKEKNGIVLVQDPATSKFDGMPRSAIDALIPDIIAPADELPAKLLAYLRFSNVTRSESIKEDKIKSNLEKIIILLRTHTGHDFSQYKKNTLFRRIERRKGVHQIDRVISYVRFLQENPKEIDILFKELLIGVTSFFRDPAVWDKIRDNIFPAMFDELPSGYVLRAWVPACSTGEEAYSLAMCFKEAIANYKKHKNFSLQVFATDLDHDAIEKARKGLFSSNIAAEVDPARLSRFFTLETEGYRVVSSIREMIVFAPQNVIKDPPFTKLDLLTCRNMLIYMETDLQKKLLGLFSYSLNPGGILVLGNAETLGTEQPGFKEIDSKLKIFKRSSSATISELQNFPSSMHNSKISVSEKIKPRKAVESIQSAVDQIILQQYSPASVVVNERGDIIYITGRTGKYIEPAAGKANWNIFVMARDGIRHELPGAFRTALKDFKAVRISNLKIGTNGGSQFVDITVQQIEAPDLVKGLIMVIFTDVPVVANPEINKSGKVKPSSIREKELELELQRSYEELQSTREEMQTSQEELQSTNEELQSTNEELTTSKEEMQSLNEELQTVNIELQSKISGYARANDDMKNLLNSTEIATLFLDKNLNIRRYTDQVTKVFKIRGTDKGRPFTDLVTDLQYPEIREHALQVIKTLAFIETAASTRDGNWFTVRIMPYRTIDDHIDGLVITFSDITQAKKLELKLLEANKALVDSKKDYDLAMHKMSIVSICDTNLRYIWSYDPDKEFSSSAIIGKRDDEISSDKGSQALLKLKKQVLENGVERDIKCTLKNKTGSKNYHIAATPLLNHEGQIIGVSTVIQDSKVKKPPEHP
ncbi:MAG: PAS domain-containing protein [Bacteroidales bacterium]|nr:PAS domain-containing protein [Bacteroidales bacterium]